MNENIVKNVLRCPVCEGELGVFGGSLKCERGHCFDIASAGYVNLVNAKQAGGGDSPELVRARTEWLSTGCYDVFADEICRRVAAAAEGGTFIDAGCGEGYYSLRAAEAASASVCGFDLSKHAVAHAARSAKRRSVNAAFAVAGIFDMPVRDGCADAVINLFAPCAAEEFLRVLKPGGSLIVAGAGERHLEGLKRLIYDDFIPNRTRADLPCLSGLTLVEQTEVSYDITVEKKEHIMALFSMTPYYYRTSGAGRARLLEAERLDTAVDFDIFVYRRTE